LCAASNPGRGRVCKAGRGLVFGRLVTLGSAFGKLTLQIGYRVVERRGHVPASASDRTSSEI
jgi:hypothetical protein